MAALVVVAATVALVSGPVEDGFVGEAGTAGMLVYKRASDGKFMQAQNDGTLAESIGYGVLLNSPLIAGAPTRVARPGALVTIGATIALGLVYYASATKGGIEVIAGTGTGAYVHVVGCAESVTVMRLLLYSAGVLSA